MKKTILEAGKIRNVHGLHGEVKAENWLESDEVFANLKRFFLKETGERELKVRSRRRQGDLFLLAFEGLEDVDAVMNLKGKTLYAARDQIDPEGRKIFYADLFGLDLIEKETGERYGKILDVVNRGASDLYVIRKADGTEAYFPAIKEWILEFDLEKGVFVKAPEGLFD